MRGDLGMAQQDVTHNGGAPFARRLPFASRFLYAFHPLSRLLAAFVAAEAGPGRLMPWLPVAFGAGIACYFALPGEPGLAPALAVAAVLLLTSVLLRRRAAPFLAAAFAAAIACGFAVATLRTVMVGHTVLSQTAFGASLAGFVEAREERERTDRFVLRLTRIDGLRDDNEPERVRLSVKKGTAPPVGSHVELRARLVPPLAPLRPGGYDFARDLYFHGIGASGFVLGAVRTVEPPSPADGWLRYAATVQGLRDAIDQRIRAAISGDERAIATALLTGKRDAVSAEVNEALFVSGLGHILSISGYHMAVVAGIVFFIVRALLAFVPAFAARFAIKKWSALAALVAALFYLLLSGAEVATQRSFVMIAIVLIGVMADRRAITFRTLAIAALVVMWLAPESVVHPSFQMSFAATLGLVALVEQGMPKLLATPDSSSVGRLALWGGREIAALLLASLIAGLATTPFAAFHFHRITPYGVIANLAAMPVVSVFVMPAGLLGLAAMPFGLDGPFWRLMDLGIDWMIAVAQWVAALPGALLRVHAFGTSALILMTLGMIALALLRTPLCLAGVAIFAAGVVWAAMTPVPDILIGANGDAVAVRAADGRLRIMRAGGDAFAVREWLAADADARTPTDKTLGEGVACDAHGCVAKDAHGRSIAFARQASALADDCRQAFLIVTSRQAPAGCAAAVIDRPLLQARGALALFAQDDQQSGGEGEGYRIEPTRPAGENRPWAKETGSADLPELIAPQQVVTRDATPRAGDLEPGD